MPVPGKLGKKFIGGRARLCRIADGADVAGGAHQPLVADELAGGEEVGGHHVGDDARPHLLLCTGT